MVPGTGGGTERNTEEGSGDSCETAPGDGFAKEQCQTFSFRGEYLLKSLQTTRQEI